MSSGKVRCLGYGRKRSILQYLILRYLQSFHKTKIWLNIFKQREQKKKEGKEKKGQYQMENLNFHQHHKNFKKK